MDPQNQDQTPVPADVPTEQTEPINDMQQQVADRLASSKSVLVTVSANPSVDELASALGLTMLLNKLSKHVTTVFSGKIPSAMQFLDPEATFEDNVDSLRDFIIALDKEKADKLRYKVEDDVVRIFITPYQTVITEKDLEFSQGDFNVDVIVALGVHSRDDLDKAILAHGRILHNAEIITVTADKRSAVGTIDWDDENSSSIAEMLVRLSASLGENLVDEQVGTALLTGIVAETNRFSNEKTSPSVMTIAAQLMAAGANQQLVATNLRQEGMISEPIRTKDTSKSSSNDDGGEMVLDHKNQKGQKQQASSAQQSKNQQKPALAKDDKSDANSNTRNNQPQNSSAKSGANQQSSSSNPNKQPADKPQDKSKSVAMPSNENDSSQPADQTVRTNDTASVAPELPKTVEAQTSSAESKPEVNSHRPKIIEPLPRPQEPAPEAQPEPSLPKIQPVKPASITEPPQFGGTLNATVAGGDQEGETALDPLGAPKPQLFEHRDATEEVSNTNAIEEARRAVEDAAAGPSDGALAQPVVGGGFEPSQNLTMAPAAPVSQPMPTFGGEVDTTVSQAQATTLPPLPGSGPAIGSNVEPSPIDDFMQPHVENSFAPASMNMPNPVAPPVPAQQNQTPSLPPLPPMPGGGSDGLPPLPPMPGATVDPVAGFQPKINPGFMESVNQSQSHLTEQGQAMSDKYAERDATRQAKLEELGNQYDAAVERNKEIQSQQNPSQPPANDHTTFPLPPPPQG